MTLVLVGKDLVLEGLSLKIEDKKVPGICMYIYIVKKSGTYDWFREMLLQINYDVECMTYSTDAGSFGKHIEW